MFRWNHIAAVIVSTAMVFSTMPLGVMAADQTGTEASVQVEPMEIGIADAGEYLSAGERTSGIAADNTDVKTGAGLEEVVIYTVATDGTTEAGADESAAGDVTKPGTNESAAGDVTGAGSNAANYESVDNGAANSDGATSGAANGNMGSAAEEIIDANDEVSTAGTDSAADAATEIEAEDVALVSIHGIVEREFVQYSEGDSEELTGQYFEPVVREADDTSDREPKSGAALKGVDKVIYDALREAVEEIAAGERDTGVVKIPISATAVGLRSKYTAEDLGLEYVYGGSLNPDLVGALEKVAPVHYDDIIECLIADSEYEMFALTGGVEKPAGYTLPFYASGSGDDLDVYLNSYVEISLKPAEKFADPDSGKYAIDTARIKVMRGTASTAKKIVKGASHIVNITGAIPTTK